MTNYCIYFCCQGLLPELQGSLVDYLFMKMDQDYLRECCSMYNEFWESKYNHFDVEYPDCNYTPLDKRESRNKSGYISFRPNEMTRYGQIQLNIDSDYCLSLMMKDIHLKPVQKLLTGFAQEHRYFKTLSWHFLDALDTEYLRLLEPLYLEAYNRMEARRQSTPLTIFQRLTCNVVERIRRLLITKPAFSYSRQDWSTSDENGPTPKKSDSPYTMFKDIPDSVSPHYKEPSVWSSEEGHVATREGLWATRRKVALSLPTNESQMYQEKFIIATPITT